MRQFSPSALLSSFQACAPLQAGGALCVAYSGGLDSSVLLHAAAQVVAEHPVYRLRAIHVDHQLHPDSVQWREHCADVARALRIELSAVQVVVPREAQAGPEAAAREARYRALREALNAGEVLLTAHHADDQLETVLLALMRGAGARGLGAMAPIQPFGAGWLARPLLQFTRDELQAWAQSAAVRWISDPSNANTTFDRNYLRHHVLPALRQRWPAAAHSATRSAAHVAEAERLLDALAACDMQAALVGRCLDVQALNVLQPARRRNVLRHWLRRCGARAPSTRKLAAIEHDMLMARHDRVPCVDWDGVAVSRHRGLLYCLTRQPALPTLALDWQPRDSLTLPAGLGRLRMVDAPDGISSAKLVQPLQVRFRAGGESLRPSGDPHRRKLKKLLQSSAVLPWWRERLPLICSGGQLVAVADLWIADEFAARDKEPAVRIVWDRKPAIHAQCRRGSS